MIEEVKRRATPRWRESATAATADEVRALEAELLGKRGPFATFKTGLGALPTVDEKGRRAGPQRGDSCGRRGARASVDASSLPPSGVVQLAAERLDLTEVMSTAAARPRACGDAGVGAAGGRVHRARLPDRRRSRGRDRLVQLRGAEHAAPTIRRAACTTRSTSTTATPGITVLRTHTSPVQIRVMQTSPPPIYMVMPGRVFRNETTDATHLAVFHQLEGLVIDRGITLADLAGTIDAFTKAFFGADFISRLRPSYFPFTEPSAEFDIQTPSGEWLELGGCGMVHPNVLRAGGLDPEEWSGFAFGFGIDRMAKERHAIGDLREMYSNDIRFMEQF